MTTNVVQNSVAQSAMPQIPLVNSTQILTQSSPVINSQVNPVAASTTTPILTNPQVSVSYAPIVSAIKPPQPAGRIPKVTVVPIYDE